MAIRVRSAAREDANAAIGVLRRSIAELCAADHLNDAQRLEDWLSNKTCDQFFKWLGAPDAPILVAETDDGVIAGVAAFSLRGQVLLNYVDPEFRFSGVSKQLLGEMEAWLRDAGVSRASLSTTVTAHQFYLSCGYEDVTPEGTQQSACSARQMRKQL